MNNRRGWTQRDEREWFAAVGAIDECVICGKWGTQVSHSNEHRGIGQKAPPWHTAAICPDCHHEIDNGRHLSRDERRRMHRDAVNATHIILIQRGTMPGTRARTEREHAS